MAQGYVFEEAEELLRTLLGIRMSGKQIQRVSEHYGQQMEEQIQQQAAGEMTAPVIPLKNKEEAMYVMLDGSMVLTRKGWKEAKVGRLFKASSTVQIQPHRKEIMQSLYVCHLGGHKKFLEKLEAYSEPYPRKVFIADGARWIWNWVEDCYPEAVQILDFYHALEKLGVYAVLQYAEENQRKQWMEEQKGRLLEGKAVELISELKAVTPAGKGARKAKKMWCATMKAICNECSITAIWKKATPLAPVPLKPLIAMWYNNASNSLASAGTKKALNKS